MIAKPLLTLMPFSRAARRGMWKDGSNAETPAEYKRRHASPGVLPVEEAKLATPKRQKTWWSKLFSR